jgi:hypothetical protein
MRLLTSSLGKVVGLRRFSLGLRPEDGGIVPDVDVFISVDVMTTVGIAATA